MGDALLCLPSLSSFVMTLRTLLSRDLTAMTTSSLASLSSTTRFTSSSSFTTIVQWKNWAIVDEPWPVVPVCPVARKCWVHVEQLCDEHSCCNGVARYFLPTRVIWPCVGLGNSFQQTPESFPRGLFSIKYTPKVIVANEGSTAQK